MYLKFLSLSGLTALSSARKVLFTHQAKHYVKDTPLQFMLDYSIDMTVRRNTKKNNKRKETESRKECMTSLSRWDGVVLISLHLLTHPIISGFNFILQIKPLIFYAPYRPTCNAVLVWHKLNLLAARFRHTMGTSSLLSHGPTDGS